MFTRNHLDETQRPAHVELQDLETDGMQELTAEDASVVRGGGTTSPLLATACATGQHIKKAVIDF